MSAFAPLRDAVDACLPKPTSAPHVLYEGKRYEAGCVVTIYDDAGHHLLPPRLDLYSHSPMGFEWGYEGSGPAQLALALCAHALGDDREALDVYQEFRDAVVSGLPHDAWTLTRDQVATVATLLIGNRRAAL